MNFLCVLCVCVVCVWCVCVCVCVVCVCVCVCVYVCVGCMGVCGVCVCVYVCGGWVGGCRVWVYVCVWCVVCGCGCMCGCVCGWVWMWVWVWVWVCMCGVSGCRCVYVCGVYGCVGCMRVCVWGVGVCTLSPCLAEPRSILPQLLRIIIYDVLSFSTFCVFAILVSSICDLSVTKCPLSKEYYICISCCM